MARYQALLLSMLLAGAAAAAAADERTPLTYQCNGRKLVWQDGREEPVMSDATIRLGIDSTARTIRLDGLAVAGRGELLESKEWFRGFLDLPVSRNGQAFPRVSINLNRFTGQVSVASLRELSPGRSERPLLHFVGQCERRLPRPAGRVRTSRQA